MAAGMHEMVVRLPGGGVERIEYAGNVAPRVVVAPVPFGMAWSAPDAFWPAPSFAAFDRLAADMDRQMDAMLRQARDLSAASFANSQQLNDAAFGNLPAGASSYTVVSSSIGNHSCTRTVETIVPANGGKAQTVSRQSGDCGGAAQHSSQRPNAPEPMGTTITYRTTAPAAGNARTSL
jgi:hypothetical protein